MTNSARTPGESGEHLQKDAFTLAVGKAGLKTEDIRYLFSGDLLGQNIATSFGLMDYQVPLFGLFTSAQHLAAKHLLAGDVRGGGVVICVVAMTSSHFASGKEPVSSAGMSQSAPAISDAVTGSGAYVLGKKRSKARITGITTGKIVDYGIKDSMNMGAAMAPAASDVICRHLSDFGRNVTDYDKIITGDLVSGRDSLWDLDEGPRWRISAKPHQTVGLRSTMQTNRERVPAVPAAGVRQ